MKKYYSHLVTLTNDSAMKLFSSRRWRLYRAKLKTVLFMLNPKKLYDTWHGTIPKMFDCWIDPVVHLLLLKSFMTQHDQIGLFLKSFGSKFGHKSSPNIWLNMFYPWKMTNFQVATAVATFGATFRNIEYFILNWSHCHGVL